LFKWEIELGLEVEEEDKKWTGKPYAMTRVE